MCRSGCETPCTNRILRIVVLCGILKFYEFTSELYKTLSPNSVNVNEGSGVIRIAEYCRNSRKCASREDDDDLASTDSSN